MQRLLRSPQASITVLGIRQRSLEAKALVTEILNTDASNSCPVHNIQNYSRFKTNCSDKYHL
jgi:hypothetical protein